ncbi:MAG: endonuclease/exonuclease/phosphatase family protein, partial [Polyangiaceae bacterium]
PNLALGCAIDPQTTAIFLIQAPGTPDVQTAFALGDPADPLHPARGLVCEDTPDAASTSLLARCALTPLPSLSIDTFNVALYGADAAFESQRRQAVVDAIAARQEDLMCITEIERDTDKAAVAQAAARSFPSSFYATDDLATVADDPTDAHGDVPPAPTQAPCAGIDPSTVSSIYACAAGCTPSGSMSDSITDSACLIDQCTTQFAPLYRAGQAQDTCFDCMIYYMTGEQPLAYGQQECTSDPVQPLAFSGSSAELILSRYPFVAGSPRAYVLPSTGFRRSVLYAAVQLEDQVVDFFCAHLISPLIDTDLPYSGNYGQDGTETLADGGVAVENGWQDEQDLQVQRAIAFIQATHASTGRPAIVAGDWQATVRYPAAAPDAGAAPVLDDLSPEVIGALDQAYGGPLVRAEPLDYVPSCTFCPAPQNPYNGAVHPADFTPTFLLGFPAGATTEDSLWGTEDSVAIQSTPWSAAPPGGQGPISNVYPRLVRVLRPPAP